MNHNVSVRNRRELTVNDAGGWRGAREELEQIPWETWHDTRMAYAYGLGENKGVSTATRVLNLLLLNVYLNI